MKSRLLQMVDLHRHVVREVQLDLVNHFGRELAFSEATARSRRDQARR